jgi:uncharacterized protein YciI
MFIVLLTYRRPIEDVEKHLAEHIEFLNAQYKAGVFVASGRRVPRNGGVILASGVEQDELEKILENDPFQREQIADYQVFEFIPTKVKPGLESLLGLVCKLVRKWEAQFQRILPLRASKAYLTNGSSSIGWLARKSSMIPSTRSKW